MAAFGTPVPTLSWTSNARIVRNPASSYPRLMATDRFAPNPSDTKDGPSVQVHGSDAIVPHRLAKNSVPSNEYLLVTPTLAERLSPTDRERFAWREENAAEFGTMQIGYYDLGTLRDPRAT